jgi:hypothetical protein
VLDAAVQRKEKKPSMLRGSPGRPTVPSPRRAPLVEHSPGAVMAQRSVEHSLQIADVDLLDSVDLTRLSPDNRELVRVIAMNIADTTEQLKEEFTQHINAVHLDLLCRIRQLTEKIERIKSPH